MPVFVDQLNRVIHLYSIPQRIISVVPSQTELLFDLGLDKQIIGVTSFCTHPEGKTSRVSKIGGTKKLNTGLIRVLKPDLIIANKEENDRAQIEALMDVCPVWISDINDLAGAIHMIKSVGEMLGREIAAEKMCLDIISQFEQLNRSALNRRFAYLIWLKPYMVAGTGTFINHLLQCCGLSNAFDLGRYPEVTNDMLINANPDVVLLSSEPYPFCEKHIREFKILLPNAKIRLADGEMFSWYGSRLLQAPRYFNELLRDITPA